MSFDALQGKQESRLSQEVRVTLSEVIDDVVPAMIRNNFLAADTMLAIQHALAVGVKEVADDVLDRSANAKYRELATTEEKVRRFLIDRIRKNVAESVGTLPEKEEQALSFLLRRHVLDAGPKR
jgi:hypothetical protein